MPLSNFEKWRLYTTRLQSPDSYINWCFYHMIGACLQRRVWCGPADQPLFANTFVILVGEPGIGKGIVIKEVTAFMRHWKLFDVVGHAPSGKSTEDNQQMEMEQKSSLKDAMDKESQGNGVQSKNTTPPILFPQASDSTSYQSLIEAIGENYRSINHYQWDETQKKDVLKTYRHSSVGFHLQELASLMRSKTEDIVNFLLGLYDCPLDYEYRTITRGRDRVRRACVNLLAGTTPSYMQSTFDSKIVNEGFSSRTFYICATKNRKNVVRMATLTPEQTLAKKEILDHLKKLSFLYGPVKIEEETWRWIEYWWDEYEKNKHLRANHSPLLKAYYSRKQIHVLKLGMIMYLAEFPTLEHPIPIEYFMKAVEFLAHEEKFMHLALMMEGDTPMSRATKFVIDSCMMGPQKFTDLYIELWKILNDKTLIENCLGFLQETNQIERLDKPVENSDKMVLYYKLL